MNNFEQTIEIFENYFAIINLSVSQQSGGIQDTGIHFRRQYFNDLTFSLSLDDPRAM